MENEKLSRLATELYLSGKCRTMAEAYETAKRQLAYPDVLKDLFNL